METEGRIATIVYLLADSAKPFVDHALLTWFGVEFGTRDVFEQATATR